MSAARQVRSLLVTALILPLAFAATLRAQVTDSTLFRPHPIKAWEAGLLVAGGVLTIALVDEPVQDWIQDPANRNSTVDDIASAARLFGQVEVIAPVTGGIILTGLIAHKPSIVNAGLRVGASVLVSSVITQAFKYSIGRNRPRETDDVWDFEPFSGADALPSGHTSAAFAFATSLSQEIHNPWATAGLFVLATGTAWSRVYENDHWVADVLMGAAVGYSSAKLATGRWTIFGLRAPVPLAGGGTVGLVWSADF